VQRSQPSRESAESATGEGCRDRATLTVRVNAHPGTGYIVREVFRHAPPRTRRSLPLYFRAPTNPLDGTYLCVTAVRAQVLKASLCIPRGICIYVPMATLIGVLLGWADVGG